MLIKGNKLWKQARLVFWYWNSTAMCVKKCYCKAESIWLNLSIHVYVIFLEIHTTAPLYVELEAYIWPLLWALPPFPPYWTCWIGRAQCLLYGDPSLYVFEKCFYKYFYVSCWRNQVIMVLIHVHMYCISFFLFLIVPRRQVKTKRPLVEANGTQKATILQKNQGKGLKGLPLEISQM